MEAEVQRAIIEAAWEVIVLPDHTLLDEESDFYVIGLDEVDTGITASQHQSANRRRGIESTVRR